MVLIGWMFGTVGQAAGPIDWSSWTVSVVSVLATVILLLLSGVLRIGKTVDKQIDDLTAELAAVRSDSKERIADWKGIADHALAQSEKLSALGQEALRIAAKVGTGGSSP